jgi:hypothetical protein
MFKFLLEKCPYLMREGVLNKITSFIPIYLLPIGKRRKIKLKKTKLQL